MSSVSSVQKDRITPGSQQTCSYLGTYEDPESWFAFPDAGNYCYRAKPFGQIDNHYQQTHCLSPNHINCQLLAQDWDKPLPEEIAVRSETNRKSLVFGILTLVILGAVGLAAYFLFEPAKQGLAAFLASPTPTVQPTVSTRPSPTARIALLLPPASPTSTNTRPAPTPVPMQSPSPLPTKTNTPTSTPIQPTRGPEIGTPFGPQSKFILHIVQEAEPLSIIAPVYGTSVEAIRASNYLIEGASIWPGKVLVILPGVKDAVDLVRFCVFYLDAPAELSALARFLAVTEEELIQYNDLDPQVDLPGKRWVIFPLQESTNPKLCK